MSASQQSVDADVVAASRDSLQAALDALATAVEGHAEVIKRENAHARALSGIREDVTRLGEKLAEDRLLRLGVVGQVKAGKSSLLNLLLFDGKEVLPKAATPMTASLTHITKSDHDEVEVEYYTKKDWAEIQEHAREYRRMKAENGTARVPDFVQASHELVEMAEERGLQVGQYLGRQKIEPTSVSELNDKLTSLVGSAGKLTPLVKSVSIRCGQGVPDLDIVDTPGINDPIGSRSRRAEKMLVDCDAVLLLSYAGQFMDNVDVRFFERRLPKEGISNRVIIGSKFDSALIDVARDAGADLQRARDETERRLATHAKEAIRRLSEEPDNDHQPASAAPEIIFISAMCSKLARTPYDQWDHEERSIFESIHKAYPDWLDPADESNATITEDTKTTLTGLGNQAQVTDHLDTLRRNKEQVIFASNQQTVDAKRAAAVKEVDELLEGLRTYRRKVNEVDAEQLEKQRKAAVGLERRLAGMVESAWQVRMEGELAEVVDLRRKLRAEAKKAKKDLKAAVEIRQETETVEKEGFFNAVWRFLGMDRSETVTYEVKVLNTSEVEQVIEEVSAYVNNEIDTLRHKLFRAKFVHDSSEELRGIVANELTNDFAQDYDFDLIGASLRDSIAKLAADARIKLDRDEFEVPELSQMGAPDSEEVDAIGAFQRLWSQIGGSDSEQIDAGLSQAREAIREAIDHATEWFEKAADELNRIAQQAKKKLVPVAVALLKESQEQLQKDIEDRAFKTSRIDIALREIEQCRSGLTGVGAPPDGTKEATN